VRRKPIARPHSSPGQGLGDLAQDLPIDGKFIAGIDDELHAK
jgi:hypothetical protein